MSTSWKTYRVTFCVRDRYSIELKARSEFDAIARAQELYTLEDEAPFIFDISQGGIDEWTAETVA